MSSKSRSDVDVAAEVEQLRKRYEHLSMKKKQEEIRKATATDASNTQLRLYEEGKKKLLIERIRSHTDARDNSNSRRNPSPIPICDRLYEEGMSKVIAEKIVEKEREQQIAMLSSPRTRNPSPIPICDRLYEEGMNKVKASRPLERDTSPLGHRRHSVSPIPICDRLYEQGMAKLKVGNGKPKVKSDSSIAISDITGDTRSSSLPPLP